MPMIWWLLVPGWISTPLLAQERPDTVWWNRLTPQDSILLEALTVNTAENEYAPVVVAGQRLVFTSDRRNDQAHAPRVFDYNENVYVTSWTGREWTGAKKFYFFNTDDQTAVCGVAGNGSRLYLYKTFHDGDIYVSQLKDGEWKRPVDAGEFINSTGHEQSIAMAGNYLVVSSERPGGMGEHDIYCAFISPQGTIGELKPVPALNTVRDEVDVRLSSDGKRLYFSSNGRDTLGYDIYASEPDTNGVWQKPVRLPAPVNSAYNDRGFFDGDSIFLMSSDRPGGSGGDDLYKGALYQAPVEQVIELPYATGMDTLFVVKTFVDKPRHTAPGDTAGQTPVQDRFEKLETYMDSLGIREYYAMVQIGAYFGLSVAQFKASYPSLRNTDIVTETFVKPSGGKITRFLVNQRFTVLREAAQLQDEMIRVHRIKDAFVAIYDKSGQRVAIYNSFTGQFIMLVK